MPRDDRRHYVTVEMPSRRVLRWSHLHVADDDHPRLLHKREFRWERAVTTDPKWMLYTLDPAISERAFTEHVRRLAIEGGWLYYHTFDSRRSAPGFPDFVFVKADVLIFAELKDLKGKVSSAQRSWLDALSMAALKGDSCGLPAHAGLEVYVWRPSDMPEIARRLLG